MCNGNKKCGPCAALSGIFSNNKNSNSNSKMKLNFKAVASPVISGLGGTAITVGSDKLIEMVYAEAKPEIKAAAPVLVSVGVALVAPGLYKKASGMFDAATAIGVYRTAQVMFPSVVAPSAEASVSGIWDSLGRPYPTFPNQGGTNKPAMA